MKGLLLSITFLLSTAFSGEPQNWYEPSNAELRIDKFSRLSNGDPGVTLSFVNGGHSIYVIEFFDEDFKMWTPWLGGILSERKETAVWFLRDEGAFHWKKISTKRFDRYLMRFVCINPELWQDYADYWVELKNNTD